MDDRIYLWAVLLVATVAASMWIDWSLTEEE